MLGSQETAIFELLPPLQSILPWRMCSVQSDRNQIPSFAYRVVAAHYLLKHHQNESLDDADMHGRRGLISLALPLQSHFTPTDYVYKITLANFLCRD